MTRILAGHDSGDGRVRVGNRLLHRRGRGLEVERHRGGEHLDVPDLLGARVQEHVLVAGGAAEVPGLEEVLEADADLTLDSADRLLEHLGEHRIGLVDADVVCELFRVSEHVVAVSLRIGAETGRGAARRVLTRIVREP